jgi:hypothetical protein
MWHTKWEHKGSWNPILYNLSYSNLPNSSYVAIELIAKDLVYIYFFWQNMKVRIPTDTLT